MIVTLDFETYYSREYSLTRMTEAEYILNQQFQVIMLSVKIDQHKPKIYVGHGNAAQALSEIDWSKAAMLAHHTRFDGAIAAWHFGVVPRLYLDTLSMSRATIHSVTGSSSLDSVSKYLNLPPKGTEVVKAIGKRLEDFSLHDLADYARYCLRDNENCWMAFNELRRVFNASEITLMDIVLRMYILPQTQLDRDALALHLHQVRTRKEETLAKVSHIGAEVFRSNDKFAGLLQLYGIDPPRKISTATNKETWAFAKGDPQFKELCQDETQPVEVQALLSARLSSKSTLEETRTERLLDQSYLSWNKCPLSSSHCLGGSSAAPGLFPIAADLGEGRWAPVPLKYSGARTHRFSGDGKVNWQNFTRGSPIRAGVVAPPGYRIVHRDSSQIEARMVAFLARCRKLLEAFEQGRDVYSEFASIVYARLITKANIKERFVGKTGILGLGYGCAGPKFRYMLFIGNGGISVTITLDEADRIVGNYRSTYPEIPALWRRGGSLIRQIIDGTRGEEYAQSQVPPVKAGYDAIWLPNGLCIAYPNIRSEMGVTGISEYVYDGPRESTHRIYGAKAIENISQALSRIVMTNIMVRVFQLTGLHPFLSTHDSLDYCVPEKDVEWWDNYLDREFAIRPSWAPDLPLASEGGWGRTLLDAEKKVNN